MRQVYKIDKDGNYVEPVLLADEEAIPKDCIEQSPPDGMYQANYDKKKKKWFDLAKPDKPQLAVMPKELRDGREVNLLLEELLSRVEALEQENRELKK